MKPLLSGRAIHLSKFPLCPKNPACCAGKPCRTLTPRPAKAYNRAGREVCWVLGVGCWGKAVCPFLHFYNSQEVEILSQHPTPNTQHPLRNGGSETANGGFHDCRADDQRGDTAENARGRAAAGSTDS